MSNSITQKLSDVKSYIALVETGEDIEEILAGLSFHNLFPSDISWLPVEVEADYFLRQKGISPISVTDLLTIDDRKRIFLDALEWSNCWLDEIPLKNEIVSFGSGCSLSDLVSYNIYYLFDDLFYLILLLEKVIKEIRPKTFVVSFNRPEKVLGLDHSNEFYLNQIAKLMAKKFSIKLLEIDSSEIDTNDTSLILTDNKSKMDGLNIYSKALSKIIGYCNSSTSYSSIDSNTRHRLEGKNILVIGGGFSSPYWRLEPLCDMLSRIKCDIWPIYHSTDKVDNSIKGISLSRNRSEKRNLPEFLELEGKINQFLKKKSFFNHIMYRGLDLNNLLDDKLYWILTQYLPEYWLDCLVLKEELEKTHIDLLIGAHQTPPDIAAVHICHSLGIPTLLIPHGVQFCLYNSKDEDKSMFNLLSPLNFSRVSVIGNYTKTKLIEYGISPDRIRCTGSIDNTKTGLIPHWLKKMSIINRKLFFQKKKMVYFLGRASRNYHMSYVNISFTEMMQSLDDVIRVASTLNYHLLIKPHPAFVYARAWIRSWAPNGDYKIITDGTYNSYLLCVADIVIGSKSSILMEALHHDIPTIIFEHEKRELHYFEDFACPLNKFKEIKDKPFFRASGFDELLYICKTIKNDREYLKCFREKSKGADPWVYHNRDNRQVNRNLKFMADIIDDKSNERAVV